MKITVKNFGPIRDFTFDLSDDLVLIVGQNNIGKSYAISLVYLLLKTFSRRQPRHEFLYDPIEDLPPSALDLGSWFKSIATHMGLAEETAQDVAATDTVTEHVRSLFDGRIARPLQESLLGTFSDISNLQNRLTQDPLEIIIDTKDVRVTLSIKDNQLVASRVDLKGHEFLIRKAKVGRTFKDKGNWTIIYFPSSNPEQFSQNYVQAIVEILLRFDSEATEAVSALHYLPASRSGLYQALSAFGQIVAELAKSRTLITKKIELPAISEPLSDYFLKLSDIRTGRLRAESRTEVYRAIASSIEQEILRGSVEFDQNTKRIMYRPDGVDLILDLSATSSMVSEISPIVSYFKYVLPRSELLERSRRIKGPQKQVIFIEEPEAHLHPEIQIKLLAIFSDVVKSCHIKVVMTSHSNYIFNKVSNLILGKEIDTSSFKGILFRRTDLGSVGELLDVSDLGIVDENFVDIAESLYAEKLDLIDTYNKNHVRRDSE